jgi:hypothetical protein
VAIAEMRQPAAASCALPVTAARAAIMQRRFEKASASLRRALGLSSAGFGS